MTANSKPVPLKQDNQEELALFLVHFIGIKYKNDGHELSDAENRALDVVKVMYQYSRSRYAKLHKVHEFKIVFLYVYTANDEEEPDKSILE